jgi:F5/8 type C domain.
MFSLSVSAAETNLAAGKSVTVSSYDSTGSEGAKVVDGAIDENHEWYSWGNANEWVCINLGSVQPFNQVKVYWGTGYAAGYKIQGSSNGTTFSDIPEATITNGTGETKIINFTAVSYQYVRLYTTTKPTGNYGHEIKELEVYDVSAPVPSAKVNGIWTDESQYQNTAADVEDWLNACIAKNIKRIHARAGFINLDGTYDGQTNEAITNNFMGEFLKVAKANNAYPGLSILAYVNAQGSPCSSTVSDSDFNTFKTAFVNYCIQMVVTGVPANNGTYYQFDGVQIDIEYCDEINMSMPRLKSILDAVRAGIGNDKFISVCATGDNDSVGHSNEWTPEHIQLIATTADEIAPMGYDSACMALPASDAASYKEYVTTKLSRYDLALSNQTHCKIGFGVPSYPSNKAHILSWETMANSLDAINAYIASKGGISNTQIGGCNIFWMNEFIGTAHSNRGYNSYRTADQNAWTSKWAN